MNSRIILACIAIACPVISSATVTLQFSTASAKLTNIQNAAGTATGGLRWGILVDTLNNGFDASGLNYDGFTFPSAGSGVFLANGASAVPTDDFFFFGPPTNTTLASAGGTDSGPNVIGTINSVPLTGGVSTGDPFALVWFDAPTTNDGDKYGFLNIPAFVIPADSSTTDFSSNFLGPDPLRLASNTLGVPEPSRLMLLGLGAVALIFRRRRN